MEVTNLNKYDKYLTCTLVVDCSEGKSFSKSYCISEDVMFQTQAINDSTRKEIYIKLWKKSSNNYNTSVRVQSKFLNFNRKYAVDVSDWRLLYSSSHDKKVHIIDFMLEIEPLFEKPLSFAPLYEDTALTDFELHGDDGSVQIHSAALAASSPALRRMLEGKWTETQDRVLKIPKTSKETLQHLKDIIYLNVLPETGVENLLSLASCYMMDDLIEKCTTHILKNLKADNATAVIKFALENNLTKLYAGVLECIEKGLLKVKDIIKKDIIIVSKT